ncbi:unnamed protein product [Heterobilharzia americana]|nr:unnamed protein product [Heterobilharzia americana]
MDDIKSALEVELERLRKLVRKYRTENIVFAKPRKSRSLEYNKMNNSHQNSGLNSNYNEVNSSEYEQPLTPNTSKPRSVQFATSNDCFENLNQRHGIDDISHPHERPENRTRFLNPLKSVGMPVAPFPSSNYLPEDEFYRTHYPLDSELVIELRTLRGVYEHTGGRNLALMAALENTLEEALKVEKDRRLGMLDDINTTKKPDYFRLDMKEITDGKQR